MPAAPEIIDILCQERFVKIDREFVPECGCQSACNIRVTAEIEVNLEGVEDRCSDHGQPVILSRVIENQIVDQCQAICHHYFFEDARADQEQSMLYIFRLIRMILFELWQEAACGFNGSGGSFAKKRYTARSLSGLCSAEITPWLTSNR